MKTVSSVNTLVRFCARRDVPALTREALQSATGARADVAILFGGSIVAGADVFANAMREQVAARCMIVGGQGHTTGALRRNLRERMGWNDTGSGTEADAIRALPPRTVTAPRRSTRAVSAVRRGLWG
jgi:hypothetical protein